MVSALTLEMGCWLSTWKSDFFVSSSWMRSSQFGSSLQSVMVAFNAPHDYVATPLIHSWTFCTLSDCEAIFLATSVQICLVVSLAVCSVLGWWEFSVSDGRVKSHSVSNQIKISDKVLSCKQWLWWRQYSYVNAECCFYQPLACFTQPLHAL